LNLEPLTLTKNKIAALRKREYQATTTILTGKNFHIF